MAESRLLMTPHWTHPLVRALSAGRLTPALESHLDALLLWLANPGNPRATDVDQALSHANVSRRQASARAYTLLDQLLFADPERPSPRTLGLPPDADPILVKRRYRRLIQVYHPDRHPTRITWATYRTERINLAFAAHRRGVNGWSSRPASTAGAGPTGESAAPGWIWPSTWVWLSQSLEMTRSFRGWLLAGMVLIGLLSVSAFFAVETPSPSAPSIIGLRVENLLPPAPPLANQMDATQLTAATDRVTVADQPTPDDATEAEPTPPVEQAISSIHPAETPALTVATPAPETPRPVETPRPAPQEIAPTAPPEPAVATRPTAIDQPSAPARETTAPAPETARIAPEPRLAIPPVPPPSPPTPPARPSPPTLASAAAVSAPITPSNAPEAVDCGTVPELLLRFQRAYDAGELNALMALYSPESRENDLVNWLSIRHTYADWFRKTSARRITFDQLNVKPTANQTRCAAIGVFQVSYLDAQRHLATQAGVIELLFERRGADLYILRVRY
jgi:hypothetical protein